MYNENDYNKYQGGGSRQDQNTDSDLDYTEGLIRTAHPHGRRTADTAAIMIPGIPGNPKPGERSGGTYQDRKPDRSYIPQEPGRNGKKGGYMAKRAAGIAAAGIIFGCVAGGTMAGVNILADKLVPETVQSSEAPALSSQAVTERRLNGAAYPFQPGMTFRQLLTKQCLP